LILGPNRYKPGADAGDDGPDRMPHYVQEQLTLGAVQDLNQVSYGLLPYIESMLARTAGANVLAIAGKAALLPGGPKWKRL